MTSTVTSTPSLLSRRQLITAANAAGTSLVAVLVLGACSGKGEKSTSASTATSPTASSTATDNDDQSVVDGLAEQVRTHWPHMSQVWPGADYTRHSIVLLKANEQLSAQAAWLITPESVRTMDSKEYAGITVPPSYDELKHEGRPAISLLLNPSFGGGEIASDVATDQNENGPAASGVEARVRTLYRLATHELVHFYHQSEAVRSASSNRDTVYPLQSEPRVLRALLHDRLNLAVTDPANRDTHLSHARSWYDQWVSGFREEVDSIREYDVREGTAVYIERRGDYVGSKLTGEELHKAQVAGLHTKRSTSVDQESYMLGFVSGILLDELRPTWKDDFYSTGKAPAELLLEGVTPVADDTGGNVRQEIEKLIAEEDARVKPAMEEVDRVTANTSVPYLRYEGRPQVSYENSYTYKGLTVLVNTILNLRSQDGEVSVVGATTLRGADATTGYNIPLEAGKYTYEDGVLKLTGETVSGRTSARRTTEDGREVFLMTVTS